MTRCWCGIDPGETGAIAFYHESSYPKRLTVIDTPIHMGHRHKELDETLFVEYMNEFNPGIVVTEDVFGIAGQGAKGSFSFGLLYGQLIVMLRSMRIRYEAVSPKTWQKARLQPGDTKAKSIEAALDIVHPSLLMRTPRSRKPSHDRADAINIAVYASTTYPDAG